MVHRTLVRVAGTAFAALFIASCSDYGPSDPGPRFEVDPVWATVEPGEVRQMTASLNGEPADVTWESSNPSVASVTSAGVVTGLSNGFTAVTAKLNSDPTMLASSSITVPLLLGTPLPANTDVAVAAEDEVLLFRVRVNAGATKLIVKLSGGTGDADIYVRYGQKPTYGPNGGGTSSTGCRPWLGGNNETCTFTNPGVGSWYIMIDPYSAYSGATLRATVEY